MNCPNNMPDPEPQKELHCVECKRIVRPDEAAIYCYGAGHQIIETKDELFSRKPK